MFGGGSVTSELSSDDKDELKCNKNHILKFVNGPVDDPAYFGGYFICNICRRNG